MKSERDNVHQLEMMSRRMRIASTGSKHQSPFQYVHRLLERHFLIPNLEKTNQVTMKTGTSSVGGHGMSHHLRWMITVIFAWYRWKAKGVVVIWCLVYMSMCKRISFLSIDNGLKNIKSIMILRFYCKIPIFGL